MGKIPLLLLELVGMMVYKSIEVLPLEIQAFQPAVVPIRAITTLTLQTKGELNVTSNSSLQCRFKDISVPARMEDGFIFCDTPPMRNIDRVSVHLDVDGKLFKTKKPLYFHEPFKVSNITPSVVSPAQNVHLTVSGISCKDWMQYYVRFQTANGKKKTQQGICKDSVVTCYVPEFSPNTRLRVGLTLSNRLVQWADEKIIIQYPVDAIRSSVHDVQSDMTRKGAFTFLVVLRDRFSNYIRLIEKENKKHARISVQYSSQDKPQSMRFLECSTILRSSVAGDAYLLSCAGAEKEHIFFYPSINNVPLGRQDRYEAITTLCPGKRSCKAEPKSFPLALALGCVGAAILVLLVVVFLFVRHRRARRPRMVRKTQVAPYETTGGLEMEVRLPENNVIQEDSTSVFQHVNVALDASDEGDASPAAELGIAEVTESNKQSSESHLGVSEADQQETERGFTQQMSLVRDETEAQMSEGIEMTKVKDEHDQVPRLHSSAERFKAPTKKKEPPKPRVIFVEPMEEAIEEINLQEQESTTDRCSTPIAGDDAQTSEERKIGKKPLKPRLTFVNPMEEAIKDVKQPSTQEQ